MFDDEGRAEPLRIILGVLANPFTRPLSERPNERKRSLWQNPDVGFTRRAVHCLRSVFANGGAGLIGNSGCKTANVCDKHAKETIRNIATYFTVPAFIILLRKSGTKVPEDVPKEGTASHGHRSVPLSTLAVFHDRLRCRRAQVVAFAHLRQCLDRISKPLTVMISTEGRRCSHRRTSTPDCAVERFSPGFRLAGHCALIDHAQPRPHSAHFHGN